MLTIDRVPVTCNRLHDTLEEALQADTARVDLRFCRECGHTFNFAFEPERVAYAPGYDNALDFSPRFQQYADELAARLAVRYDLRDKTVVEVGCGRGAFLSSLCRIGDNRGIGYDPSAPRGLESEPKVRIERVPYSEQARGDDADFLLCRHCLEHMDDPVAFLRTVRANVAASREAAVFVEVPSFLFTLRDGGIWDVIYEHCGYFTPASLWRAFDVAGLHVTEIAETFGGQYLTAHAVALPTHAPRPIPARRPHPQHQPELAGLVRLLASRYEAVVAYWRTRLDQLARRGRRVVVWGAGSKGTSFLNAVHPHGGIGQVVDISPLKHGRFVPVTGERIIAPAELPELRPDLVLLMNPIYRDEVVSMVRTLGLDPNIVTTVTHDPEQTESQHRATGS